MKLEPVESSNIAAVGWTQETGLVIEFKGKTRYIYPTIPREIFQDFMSSESKGRFFSANIRSNTDLIYAKLEPGDDLVVKARELRAKRMETAES